MSKTLHVIFDGKVLRPEEPVDLKPNTHYIVTIEREETSGKQNLWDVLSDLTGVVEGPEDWSQEHNHYLLVYPTTEGHKNKKFYPFFPRQTLQIDALSKEISNGSNTIYLK